MHEFIEDIGGWIKTIFNFLWDNGYQFYFIWWYAIDQTSIFCNNQINGCLEQGKDTYTCKQTLYTITLYKVGKSNCNVLINFTAWLTFYKLWI